MTIVVNRARLALAVLALAAAGTLAGWLLQPDRRLDRAWDGFLEGFATRRAAAVRAHLAEDYADRWGHDRESIGDELRMAFFHLETLQVTATRVRRSRAGDDARIEAVIRAEATGSAFAIDSVGLFNRLEAPFSIEWRRDAGFPWAWRVVRIDHPDFEPAGYRRSGG